MSDISPPKTFQVSSTLLSAGMGTGEGMLASARERQNPQRQRMFHWSILVWRRSFSSWSLAVWDSLMVFTGGSISFF